MEKRIIKAIIVERQQEISKIQLLKDRYILRSRRIMFWLVFVVRVSLIKCIRIYRIL